MSVLVQIARKYIHHKKLKKWCCSNTSDGNRTQVPRLLQALRRVDIGEGLLERLVIRARQAVLVEVVPGGYDEVDVELLPNLSHLHMGNHSLFSSHQRALAATLLECTAVRTSNNKNNCILLEEKNQSVRRPLGHRRLLLCSDN